MIVSCLAGFGYLFWGGCVGFPQGDVEIEELSFAQLPGELDVGV